MEDGSGEFAYPTSNNNIDKSRVLDVKPMRMLKPIFPSPNQGQPFVTAPPIGNFPPGFSPFYPFSPAQAQQTQAISTPDLNQSQSMPASYVPPLRSFRTPTESYGPSGSRGRGRPKGSSKSNPRKMAKMNLVKDVTGSASRSRPAVTQAIANFNSGISESEREDGNSGTATNVLMRFDAVRRRLSQLEDAKRATLKAAGNLMSRGVRTNTKKRIGVVPGIEVGDIFFFRIEMCLVGLHSQTMAGIDYMTIKGEAEEELMATSIVSAGVYDDSTEDPDILIYSGHGGNADKYKQASDQKLERGNLALERSLRKNNPVRVTRGVKDTVNPTSKVYVYDGLYTIKESWVEKGKSGCNTFKYKLVRMPDQPPVFSVWKSIQKWREGSSPRAGLILPDLTSGAEIIPVSLVNDVDDEKGPAYFTYFPTLKGSGSFKLTQSSVGCHCHNSCQAGNLNCSCVRKNDGDLPYITNGILVARRSLVYECGPTCPCYATCKNKLIQSGLKFRLEVFKTANRGWGLRSWDPIRAGSFLCEYAGEFKDKSKMKEDDEDDYLFDTTRVFSPLKWNYEPGLVEDCDPVESSENSEDFDLPSPIIISAKDVGNVARFMNHSCSPNVLWQPVVCENNGELIVRIAFFAIRHIPPMTELTYDYGVSRSNETENGSSSNGKEKCLCGSEKCRGFFG